MRQVALTGWTIPMTLLLVASCGDSRSPILTEHTDPPILIGRTASKAEWLRSESTRGTRCTDDPCCRRTDPAYPHHRTIQAEDHCTKLLTADYKIFNADGSCIEANLDKLPRSFVFEGTDWAEETGRGPAQTIEYTMTGTDDDGKTLTLRLKIGDDGQSNSWAIEKEDGEQCTLSDAMPRQDKIPEEFLKLETLTRAGATGDRFPLTFAACHHRGCLHAAQ